MISGEFIVKKNKYLLPLASILALGAYLRLFKITKAFPFDHDQEFVANSAYNFFVSDKLTLIGQELSFGGFFLGPLHNWILFAPYRICNLSPACVPYFFITVGLITVALLYLVVKKVTDKKTAVVAAAIYALSFAAITSERGASSNFFLFLSSLAIFFSLHIYFSWKDPALPLGAFIAGLATVNFNPVFIFSATAFFTTSLLREKRKLSLYLLSIAAFLINYLPLVIFNFRHQNILWQNFENFLKQNTSPLNFFQRLEYLTSEVVLPLYTNFIFNSTSLIFTLLTIAIIIFSLYLILLEKKQFLYVLPIWIFTVIFGFSLYGGNIPDYYFQQTLLPLVILTAIVATRHFAIFIFFSFLLLVTNINKAINYSSIINYQVKDEVVNFILNDADDTSFNVYYDLPPGFNTGYSYLFKSKHRLPQVGGKNLYIIELVDPQKFNFEKYQNAFRGKNLDVKLISYIHVISVK